MAGVVWQKTRKEFRTADLRRCNTDKGSSMALVLAYVSGLVNPELLLQVDYLPRESNP